MCCLAPFSRCLLGYLCLQIRQAGSGEAAGLRAARLCVTVLLVPIEWDRGDWQLDAPPGSPRQSPLCKQLLPLVSSVPISQARRRRMFLFPAEGLERKSKSSELQRKEHPPLHPAYVQEGRKSK